MRMKKDFFLLVTVLLLFVTMQAGTNRQRVFHSYPDSIPYRIPALATCSNGDLLAVVDYRYCQSDIGYGAVDLRYKISKDNGRTWGREFVLADGTGVGNDNVWNFAFGDCALVADSKSDNVLAVCAAGQRSYGRSTRDNPIRVVRFRSKDNGRTWNKGEEITEGIYDLFKDEKGKSVGGLFFSSGRICQSGKIKVGRFYRLYSALLTHKGVFVVFSDDFGETWRVLGGAEQSACPKGDETKCEELPDGSVLLSSRTWGRYFNRFTYTDVAAGDGHWDVSEAAPAFKDIQNACNGEILLLPGHCKGKRGKVKVLVQSVPAGPGRTHVTFFYKVLKNETDYASSQALAEGWQRGKEVSSWISAYSTMILQHDGRIGFLWEEGPTIFHIDYETFTLSDVTLGACY